MPIHKAIRNLTHTLPCGILGLPLELPEGVPVPERNRGLPYSRPTQNTIWATDRHQTKMLIHKTDRNLTHTWTDPWPSSQAPWRPARPPGAALRRKIIWATPHPSFIVGSGSIPIHKIHRNLTHTWRDPWPSSQAPWRRARPPGAAPPWPAGPCSAPRTPSAASPGSEQNIKKIFDKIRKDKGYKGLVATCHSCWIYSCLFEYSTEVGITNGMHEDNC